MKKHYAPSFYGGICRQPSAGVAARLRQYAGFTLTEVVLAVGVLSLAIVALVGLFGPTMGAVKQVIDRSGALAVADHINAQLLSNEIYKDYSIDTTADPFLQLSQRLHGGSSAEPVLYSWREYEDSSSGRGDMTALSLQLSRDKPSQAVLSRIEGSVYLVILERGLQGSGNNFNFDNVDTSAYFPIKVSIFEMPMNLVAGTGTINMEEYRSGLRGKPLFQYTTAKLR